MIMGNAMLEQQLHELGLETWSPAPGFIAFKYTVPHGRFRDREVSIALQALQFPAIPPSGIHVSPHIMPNTGGGGKHPDGGIHDRKQPTAEFQYWSRPFPEWNNSNKHAKDYIGFINTLFDFQ